MDVFWVGPDGSVRSTWWHEGHGWSKDAAGAPAPYAIASAGNAALGASATQTRNPDHMDVFWIGSDGSVRGNWWHEGHGWAAPYAIAPEGNAALGAIATQTRNPDHMDVFWIGPDGSVRGNWWHQ
jgi:hypothetical protein